MTSGTIGMGENHANERMTLHAGCHALPSPVGALHQRMSDL